VLAFLILFAAVANTGTPPPLPPLSSTPRVPQVEVSGTALQERFLSVGESIDVGRDQVHAELVASNVSNNSTQTMQIELSAASPQTAVGIYDGHAAVPTLIPLFPEQASAGWFSVASFRTNPTRVVVNVFNHEAMLVSSTTYPGGNRNGVGYCLQGPNGTHYSQDARNPGGSPQGLFFRGTGPNDGQLWLAFEDRSLQAGADRDFDDVILFIEYGFGYVVPVESTTWGQLKARFR
jgi:hypothetical protein